ncbi:MAG: antibiotic biosynthesis monooxygenase [Actinobacteria bacterium]|nr:antibiotic biosynthesis monooxygenase [Actinomycetota bacterium]
MVALTAHYRCRDGCSERVSEVLTSYAPLVRSEPGCLLFLAYRHAEDLNEFTLVEEYLNEDALEAHMSSKHFKDVIQKQIVPLLELRERTLLISLNEL